MKGVVIAAGRGGRLSGLGEPKPLVPVAGRPLLMHVMERAFAGGLEEVLVVSGYRHGDIATFLETVRADRGYRVRNIHNPHWESGQHTSVRAAEPYLDGPFVLMMADHLFDPSIVRDLAAAPVENADILLAVDRDLENPRVDLDDVTRVETDGDRIVRIGKHMKAYDAFDTGLFLCRPVLFDALDRTGKAAPGLSDGVQLIAERGRARVLDIGARFWIDVDDKRMHALAGRALSSGL